MQSQSSHDSSAALYQAWAWFEAHKKQVIMGVVAAAVVGLIIFFVVWRKNETHSAASAAFSKAFIGEMTGQGTNAAGYQAVISQYPGTPSARRAELILAAALFTAGKYADAQAAFRSSPVSMETLPWPRRAGWASPLPWKPKAKPTRRCGRMKM